MIESFRENGLNALASSGNLKVSRLELLLTSIFHSRDFILLIIKLFINIFLDLNKRLPASQQVDTDRAIATLLHFLLSAYDRFVFQKTKIIIKCLLMILIFFKCFRKL